MSIYAVGTDLACVRRGMRCEWWSAVPNAPVKITARDIPALAGLAAARDCGGRSVAAQLRTIPVCTRGQAPAVSGRSTPHQQPLAIWSMTCCQMPRLSALHVGGASFNISRSRIRTRKGT